MIEQTKRCCTCTTEKPLGEYYKENGRLDGLSPACKVCSNKRAKLYRKTNKEHVSKLDRKSYLKLTYGITQVQYKDMLKEQNGVCSICGLLESDILRGKIKSMSVDHCHENGHVRGLLCSKCNTGLGAFKDNIDILASAISYLKNAEYKKTGS